MNKFIPHRLKLSSPEVVYNYLKDKHIKNILNLSEELAEEVEEVLIKRNNPLINLGLAQFGLFEKTGRFLFNNCGEEIKSAVLSGKTINSKDIGGLGFIDTSWIIKDKIINKLLDDKNEVLLESFFTNKHLESDILESLYQREEMFSDIEDKIWCQLIIFTSKNLRISTKYDSEWMDGYDMYSYNKLFNIGWKLFDLVPQTKLFMAALICLGNKLVKEQDIDISKSIERWKETNNHPESKYFHTIRTILASLIPVSSELFNSLKESKDIALRRAYYENFYTRKPEEIRTFFNKDGEDFLMLALSNIKLFTNNEVREELNKCCWENKDPNGYMDYPNYFNMHYNEYLDKHPELFDNNENKNHLLEISKKIDNINEKLDINITSNINSNLLNKARHPAVGILITIFFIGLAVGLLF